LILVGLKVFNFINYSEGGNYEVVLEVEKSCVYNLNCSQDEPLNRNIKPSKLYKYSSDTIITISSSDVTWSIRNEIQQRILNKKIYYLSMFTLVMTILSFTPRWNKSNPL